MPRDLKNRLLYNIQMSATQQNTADIYIYSEIKPDEETWWGSIRESDTSAEAFRKKLAELGNVSNINLYINSNGGSCMEGNGIYSQLKRHKAFKTAYIDGFACSEASVIPMACDKIVMSNNAVMMIHNAWTVAIGNSKELRKQADDLEIMNTAFRQAYLKRFKGTEKELIELLDNETYLNAKQCVEYGLADEIIDEINVPNDVNNKNNHDDGNSEPKPNPNQKSLDYLVALINKKGMIF